MAAGERQTGRISETTSIGAGPWTFSHLEYPWGEFPKDKIESVITGGMEWWWGKFPNRLQVAKEFPNGGLGVIVIPEAEIAGIRINRYAMLKINDWAQSEKGCEALSQEIRRYCGTVQEQAAASLLVCLRRNKLFDRMPQAA